LATVAYPELSPQLAMRIGKRATLGEMDPRGWSAFAADAGVGLPLIRRRVSEISQAVIARAHDVADEVMRPGLDEAALSQVSAMAVKRAELCAVTTYD
jgi:serine/threonine-protein kinase HipA